MSKTRKVIAVDSQMLNTHASCNRKFDLYHIQNWRPGQVGEPLERGDLVHVILAEYYRARMRGKTELPEMLSVAIEAGRNRALDLALTPEEAEYIIRVSVENLAHWHQDGWKVLFVEQPFSKVIFEDEDYVFLYEGIMDLGVETFFGPMVVDHKSGKRREDPHKLSNQFMGYSWAADLPNVMINRVGMQKSLKTADKFQRQHISYAKELISEWRTNTIHEIKKMAFNAKHNLWTPNFTSCDKFGGCLFEEVCEVAPAMRPYKIEARFYKGEPWSPYTRDKKNDTEPDGSAPVDQQGQ